MNCGLLGRHLTHSYSPQIHRQLGNYRYDLLEVEPDKLAGFLQKKDFDGLNVTIPYKKEVIGYCDDLSPQAALLGAVNTIVKTADGRLIGHNTDYFGFAAMLTASGLSVAGKKVLVLGSGGASATVTAVLNGNHAKVVVISRHGENHYGNLHLHSDASVIVNCTPVGMYPDNGASPVDLSLFPNLEGVLDLIYNPARTALLLDAERRGIISRNGLYMLVAQAKESAEWFTGRKIPDDRIREIYEKLKADMENIVLIGMPGCGKSTVGRLLSKTLNREFIDTDRLIVEKTGISIPEIFASIGEKGFRRLETEVLTDTSKQSGVIIATGGGCVTRPENYPLLHQNSKIVWLKRDISLLPTDGRPLSQAQRIDAMYQVRAPLYEAFADIIIDNDTTPEAAVNSILGGQK
ncbi:MAG: shikimate kinase [Ruminococcaceae bacterium]|nr:shikimate kinase [Oscillospiraceae bacterium]